MRQEQHEERKCVRGGGVVSSLLGHRCHRAVPILSSIGNGSTPRHRSLLSSPPPCFCLGYSILPIKSQLQEYWLPSNAINGSLLGMMLKCVRAPYSVHGLLLYQQRGGPDRQNNHGSRREKNKGQVFHLVACGSLKTRPMSAFVS